MGEAIVCDQLTKHFGAVHAVEELSFAVDAGEVVGFLGPNGAGKTTTIHLLLDLIRPTGGRVEVLGVISTSRNALASISCIGSIVNNRHFGDTFGRFTRDLRRE